MAILKNIVVIYLAANVALPAFWCRAIPICPLACCQAQTVAADQSECCGAAKSCCCNSKTTNHKGPCRKTCNCGKNKVLAKSEEVTPAVWLPLAAIGDLGPTILPVSAGSLTVSVPPQDVHKMLCRWTC